MNYDYFINVNSKNWSDSISKLKEMEEGMSFESIYRYIGRLSKKGGFNSLILEHILCCFKHFHTQVGSQKESRSTQSQKHFSFQQTDGFDLCLRRPEVSIIQLSGHY